MKTLGLIGCGKMGSALLAGIIESGTLPAKEIIICNRTLSNALAFQERYPEVQIADSIPELLQQTEKVMLGVKPKDILSILNAHPTETSKLWISLAAGITLSQLQSTLIPTARIIRVMPNTPAQVGYGYSAYANSSNVSNADSQFTHNLLSSVGIAQEIQESQMDAITGLSGSGPAYIFTILEALSDAGVLMGLPRPIAAQAATQTLLGAAYMVQETGQHPALLREAVTSPGGTTIAGLEQLEELGLRNALIKAVRKASERSKELAKES